MKAADLREALWAGATGYVLGVYAQFLGLYHPLASSPAATGSTAIAMGAGMFAAVILGRLSIGAGILFFAVALCFRFYMPRKDRTTLSLSSLVRETKWNLCKTIVCMVILFDLVPTAGFDLLLHHVEMSREVLRVPVAFGRDEFASPLFDAPSNGTYSLSLMLGKYFDSNGQLSQKERCEIGLPEEKANECAGITRIAEFNWKVVGDDGAVLQQGTYQPLTGSGWIRFGEFQAMRGRSQRIELSSVPHAQELETFRPVLSVFNMTPGRWDSDEVSRSAGWYFLFAGFASTIGVLVLVLSLLWHGISYAVRWARN